MEACKIDSHANRVPRLLSGEKIFSLLNLDSVRLNFSLTLKAKIERQHRGASATVMPHQSWGPHDQASFDIPPV